MTVWDTFMFHDELDMLECRLTELEDVQGLKHVVIESEVTHQDKPKPSYLRDNWSRFERWCDRIIPVWATDLPTMADNPDPWAREIAQREWAREGLKDAESHDVVLHGDVDEIPTAVVARNIKPRDRYIALEQRGHFWSLRWLYPIPWCGTVAAEAGRITSFGAMRDQRNTAMKIQAAGWHLSWLGGQARALKKVDSFCHPEVEDRIRNGLTSDQFLTDGVHVDGVKMIRCQINESFPKWVRDGKHPKDWEL